MKNVSNSKFQFYFLGLIFAILWASASSASKIGVQEMEPLMLFQFRFFTAGVLMLIITKLKGEFRLPNRNELFSLSLFGLLNTTLYLSFFVLSIRDLAAGMGSLFPSLSPVLMTIMGGLFYNRRVKKEHWFGLLLGFLGVSLAVWPLLQSVYATPKALVLISLAMVSYSFGSVYYSEKKWQMSILTINGWQIILGGLFMLPITLYFKTEPLHFSLKSVAIIGWLAIPVSIGSINIWLKLLKIDALRASFFLFLSPIFGFMFSYFLLHEPFTWHTLGGLMLVLIGMYFGQRK